MEMEQSDWTGKTVFQLRHPLQNMCRYVEMTLQISGIDGAKCKIPMSVHGEKSRNYKTHQKSNLTKSHLRCYTFGR